MVEEVELGLKEEGGGASEVEEIGFAGEEISGVVALDETDRGASRAES